MSRVNWSYFKKFSKVIDKYMPSSGEGDTIASQLVTAINKLIYKWYNDGDVYDNTHSLKGWANDLSDYANWIYRHFNSSRQILDRIETIRTEEEYEQLLKDLADKYLGDEEKLSKYDNKQSTGSIYDCDGPFIYDSDDPWDDDEEDEWTDEDGVIHSRWY